MKRTIEEIVIIQLPPEIYGDIILQAGSIPLLKLIYCSLYKSYQHIIGEYLSLISPITIKEAKNYYQNNNIISSVIFLYNEDCFQTQKTPSFSYNRGCFQA